MSIVCLLIFFDSNDLLMMVIEVVIKCLSDVLKVMLMGFCVVLSVTVASMFLSFYSAMKINEKVLIKVVKFGECFCVFVDLYIIFVVFVNFLWFLGVVLFGFMFSVFFNVFILKNKSIVIAAYFFIGSVVINEFGNCWKVFLIVIDIIVIVVNVFVVFINICNFFKCIVSNVVMKKVLFSSSFTKMSANVVVNSFFVVVFIIFCYVLFMNVVDFKFNEMYSINFIRMYDFNIVVCSVYLVVGLFASFRIIFMNFKLYLILFVLYLFGGLFDVFDVFIV